MIRNHFFKYSTEARDSVKVVTVDMSGSYMLLIKILFPQAKIVIDRCHIVQHMNRALKYYWKLIQKDSRKFSLKVFYFRTFKETLMFRECLDKIFKLVPELKDYYDLYNYLFFTCERSIQNSSST